MLLRELSLRGAGSGVTDWFLWRILNSSSRLRSLDLSGCSRVTPPGLMALPAELEVLSLALPGGSEQFLAPPYGSSKVTCRWGRSLRELDLSGRQFNERDLAEAMAALGPQAPLRALNMANTRVSARALSVLLSSCPHLSFLDLSSCRRLPRGTKRAHRGRSQVRRCLRVLAGLDPEEEPANGEPANEEPANEEAANEEAANGEPANEEPANGEPANEDADSEDADSEELLIMELDQ
ncbi:F-box/LRR-repeat protein 6-like [Melopsittacus undulatus]|uniref:F-box/LRR-repeat protein 6-like n=1 Tax=Melopsittacus undulatus TaxID=13146 RepID=UPI00146A5AAC|nr:F-box/LRR-repeat protein 6-like [Melopsittacus undulatus]